MARSVFVFSPKMSGGFGRFFSPPNCRLFSVVFLLLWAVERNRPKETESVFWFRFFGRPKNRFKNSVSVGKPDRKKRLSRFSVHNPGYDTTLVPTTISVNIRITLIFFLTD